MKKELKTRMCAIPRSQAGAQTTVAREAILPPPGIRKFGTSREAAEPASVKIISPLPFRDTPEQGWASNHASASILSSRIPPTREQFLGVVRHRPPGKYGLERS